MNTNELKPRLQEIVIENVTISIQIGVVEYGPLK